MRGNSGRGCNSPGKFQEWSARKGHCERNEEHDSPRRHLGTGIRIRRTFNPSHTAAPSAKARSDFQKQREHHFLHVFAFSILSTGIRNWRRSSIAPSALPTRTSSSEPPQNQSTIWLMAVAATRLRGSFA
jgi:hypothetical protein